MQGIACFCHALFMVEQDAGRQRFSLDACLVLNLSWLMDWHLSLAQIPGRNGGPLRRDITLQELKQHRSLDDAWTVLRGKVRSIDAF